MIAQMLEKKGVRNYLVEFGGEMRVKGVNPSGMDWRLGITKPTDDAAGMNQELEQIVSFPKPLGMATSGNYRNFLYKRMDVNTPIRSTLVKVALYSGISLALRSSLRMP